MISTLCESVTLWEWLLIILVTSTTDCVTHTISHVWGTLRLQMFDVSVCQYRACGRSHRHTRLGLSWWPAMQSLWLKCVRRYVDLVKRLDHSLSSQYVHSRHVTSRHSRHVMSWFRAHRKLQVCLDGQRLMHDPCPKYLGVTLDRTLSLREHLVKTAGLSLIHIWRCRRSTLCRSRWSPYH